MQDGVAFPDTLVGTDIHTPQVDALGVIAIGVGGLEAESVMLGRASWMRLPDIVGVELTGKPQPGITATDIVLALTEFLRKQKVVGAYLEFFGEGAAGADAGRPRHDLQHGARNSAPPRRCSPSTSRPSSTCRLTGRDDEQVKLVETYAQGQPGLWADTPGRRPSTSACCSFDLSTVVRNIAGPSNPHKRVPTSELAARGIAGAVGETSRA